MKYPLRPEWKAREAYRGKGPLSAGGSRKSLDEVVFELSWKEGLRREHCRLGETRELDPDAETHRLGLEEKSESHREPRAEALECCAEEPGGLTLDPERALSWLGVSPRGQGWARACARRPCA